MRLRLQPDSRDSGAIAVVVAVFAVVMFGFGAIVVDLGLAREIRSGAQNTADAAALAGAGALYDTNGVPLRVEDSAQVVRDFAARNGTPAGEWDTCAQNDPPDGYTPMGSGSACILYADDDSDVDTDPDRVWVSLPAEDSPSIFGGLIGYEGTSIGAVAVAETQSRPRFDCALCVSGMLDVGNVAVRGGSVHAGDGRVESNGSIAVAPGTIEFEQVPRPSSGSDRFDPDPPSVTGAPVLDPFASLALPSWSGATAGAADVDCGATPMEPGVYGTIRARNGTCTLGPGTYFITRILDVRGGSQLVADGVTLVFTCGNGTSPVECNDGQRGGRLEVRGDLTLTRGTDSAAALIYDPGNASDLRVRGGGTTNISGDVYAAGGTFVIRNRSTVHVGGRVVVEEVDMNGSSAQLSVTVDPPLPQVPGRPQLALAPVN